MSTVAQRQQPPLPLEVCELIINQLAWTPKPDNIGALKACALASRTFLPCCRKHLFKTIKVLPELESSANVTVAQRHGRATARLTAPLIINPDLAQYVRILHVCVRDTNHDDRFFAQMLRRLKNIEKLFIKSRRGPNDLFKRWNNIATGIRTSLEGTMTSLSLLELNLNSIHEVPCYLLASARNLRHLSFLNVTFSIQHPPEAQTLPIPSLKSLSFSNADASITTLLQARFNQSPVFSLAHLKHIVLPMEFDAATEILRSATSIESIALVVSHITAQYFSGGIGESMLLTRLKTLKKFHATVKGRRPNRLDPLPCIQTILRKWAGINVLEDLELDLRPAQWEGTGTLLAEEVKRTLDVLANQDHFSALRRVVVNVQHFTTRKGKLVEINGELRQALTLLEAIDSRFCVNISPYIDAL